MSKFIRLSQQDIKQEWENLPMQQTKPSVEARIKLRIKIT